MNASLRRWPLLPAMALLAGVLLLAPAWAGDGKGTLGFTVHMTAERQLLDAKLKRVVVTGVAPGLPAERAGLKAGDVIEQVNGTPVAGGSGRAMFGALGKARPGERVALVVRRDEATLAVTIIAD